MRLLNMRINFYLLQTFCPHIGNFFFVSSHDVSAKIHLWPSLGDRSRIGMLSLVTVSPEITAFHSCCLSPHVFDQVNLWVGTETAMLTWNRRDSTPQSATPRAQKGDEGWIF